MNIDISTDQFNSQNTVSIDDYGPITQIVLPCPLLRGSVIRVFCGEDSFSIPWVSPCYISPETIQFSIECSYVSRLLGHSISTSYIDEFKKVALETYFDITDSQLDCDENLSSTIIWRLLENIAVLRDAVFAPAHLIDTKLLAAALSPDVKYLITSKIDIDPIEFVSSLHIQSHHFNLAESFVSIRSAYELMLHEANILQNNCFKYTLSTLMNVIPPESGITEEQIYTNYVCSIEK